jgi:hypothetical protein
MYYFIRNGKYVIILLYFFDDIFVIGDDRNQINHVEKELKQVFEMSDLGDVKLYLGIKCIYQKEGIFVSQHRYIQHLLECFKVTYCHTNKVPMHKGTKLCQMET